MVKFSLQLIILGSIFLTSSAYSAIWPPECPKCEPKTIIKEVDKPVPIIIPLGTMRATGDAVEPDVLEGKTFSNENNVDLTGTMPNNGAMAFAPGTTDQTIPEGYHNGSGTVVGDSNLLPGNIKSGATIFGVTGTSIESSGTATPDQVLDSETFSNASGPATGTMPNIGKQTIIPTTTNQAISLGYHDGNGYCVGDPELVTGNLRANVNIFGVKGDPNVVDTRYATAQASDIRLYRSAYVKGKYVSGSMPTQGISSYKTEVPAGYYNATDLKAVERDLNANNIKHGITMFGITGTHKIDVYCDPYNNNLCVNTGLRGCKYDLEKFLSDKCAWNSRMTPPCPSDPDPTPLVNNGYLSILLNDCTSQGYGRLDWYMGGASCYVYYGNYKEDKHRYEEGKCITKNEFCSRNYPHVQCY